MLAISDLQIYLLCKWVDLPQNVVLHYVYEQP